MVKRKRKPMSYRNDLKLQNVRVALENERLKIMTLETVLGANHVEMARLRTALAASCERELALRKENKRLQENFRKRRWRMRKNEPA